MTPPIRPAALSDAAGIAAVMVAVWPNEPPDETLVRASLADPDHAAFVAESPDGRILAFADGFMTRDSTGTPRWEFDLLATRPEARGRGLGRALVASCSAEGDRRGARFCRSLIRIGNVASETVFSRCGFAVVETVLALLVREGQPLAMLPGMLPVPVRTFRYEGIWLEPGGEKPAGEGVELSGEIAGVLLPEDDETGLRRAQAAGFAPGGLFRWWRLNW